MRRVSDLIKDMEKSISYIFAGIGIPIIIFFWTSLFYVIATDPTVIAADFGGQSLELATWQYALFARIRLLPRCSHWSIHRILNMRTYQSMDKKNLLCSRRRKAKIFLLASTRDTPHSPSPRPSATLSPLWADWASSTLTGFIIFHCHYF